MVRIRLSRIGAKKRPFYRVVVTDSTRARGGRSKEVIGTYDPLTDPATIRIVEDRALYWLTVGAQPTDTARYLLEEAGVWADFMKAKGKDYQPKAKSEPAAPPGEPEPTPEEVAPEETPVETPVEPEGTLSETASEEPAASEEAGTEQES